MLLPIKKIETLGIGIEIIVVIFIPMISLASSVLYHLVSRILFTKLTMHKSKYLLACVVLLVH